MSFNINKAILLGNVVKDPELRYTSSGKPWITFTLVTNHDIKNQDGTYRQEATFHRIVFFGKLGEWLSNNLYKGDQCYVDGRISTREYEDKSGVKQRSREIMVDNIIPMKKAQNSRRNDEEDYSEPQGRSNAGSKTKDEEISLDDLDFNDLGLPLNQDLDSAADSLKGNEPEKKKSTRSKNA